MFSVLDFGGISFSLKINMEHKKKKGGKAKKNKQDKVNWECDFTAYTLFQEGSAGAPCLSFDILQDELGNRTFDAPVTCYIVAGTQAPNTHLNNVIVLKLCNMAKIKQEQSDDDESDSDEEEDERKCSVSATQVVHNGCINRIRATVIRGVPFAATWSELGRVHLWSLKNMLHGVSSPLANSQFQLNHNQEQAVFTFSGHQNEGFAIDWSPFMEGTLATGDCQQEIHILHPGEGGNWTDGSGAYVSHTDSVEDIQWSPNEQCVFASCSVDKSIKIWDIRAKPQKACMLTKDEAHTSDVNVIHWNRNQPFIVSGGDDKRVLVWDLRQFPGSSAVAEFSYHSGPVSTVEWHPTDSSVFASGSADDQILQWDLAIEKDESTEEDEGDKDIPHQLLFVHKGQNDIKELHWHPQIPGLVISTAQSGFNIFKTISC